jgi:UDP-2,3-diacylglucosamine hydrolase
MFDADLSFPEGARIALLSDVHLQAQDAATHALWVSTLQSLQADALFILGDLFEVWVGDDALLAPGTEGLNFEAQCAAALSQLSSRMPVYFMAGNRDFLAGPGLMASSGMTSLPDPSSINLGGQRLLLSHGDALCLADTAYQAFRQQVRGAAWQQSFLARPLAERQALAKAMREQSAKRQQDPSVRELGDADDDLALRWLRQADASVLIHGHTHRPADHALDSAHWRVVLSDWDAQAQPPRAELLWLHRDGWLRQALAPQQPARSATRA